MAALRFTSPPCFFHALAALVSLTSPLSARAATPASAPVAPCQEPEQHQLDFWVGDWDAAIRTRPSPDSDQWTEAKGANHIHRALGGCVVEESFAAAGPGSPWNGKSASVWVPQIHAWRQTWVDDSGGYLAFRGGQEGSKVVLYGEPRDVGKGQTIQMRMVFQDITAGSFRWTWERGTPNGKTWKAVMEIHYTRQRPTP